MENQTNNRMYYTTQVNQHTNWTNGSMRSQYSSSIIPPQVPAQAQPTTGVPQQAYFVPYPAPICTYVPQHPSVMQQLAYPPMIPYESMYPPQGQLIQIAPSYMQPYRLYRPAQMKSRPHSIPIVDPKTLQDQNAVVQENKVITTKPKSPEKPNQEPHQQYQILRKEPNYNQANNNSYQQFPRSHHRQSNRGRYHKNFQNYNKSPTVYKSPVKSTLDVVPEVDVFDEKPKTETETKMKDESTPKPDIDGLSDISSTTLNVSSIEFKASFNLTDSEMSKDTVNNTLDNSVNDNSSVVSDTSTVPNSTETSSQSRSVNVTANLTVKIVDKASVIEKTIEQPEPEVVKQEEPIEEVSLEIETPVPEVAKEASEDVPVVENVDKPQENNTAVPEATTAVEKETPPNTEKLEQPSRTEATFKTIKSEKYVETSTSVQCASRHYQNNSGSNYNYSNRNYTTKKYTKTEHSNYGDKYSNNYNNTSYQYHQVPHHQPYNNYSRSNNQYNTNYNYNKQNNGRKSMDKNNYGSHYNNNYDQPPKNNNRQYKSSNSNVHRNLGWESCSRQPAKPAVTSLAVTQVPTVPAVTEVPTVQAVTQVPAVTQLPKVPAVKPNVIHNKTPKIPKVVEKPVLRYDFEAIFGIIRKTHEWDKPNFIEPEKYEAAVLVEIIPDMCDEPMALLHMINSRFEMGKEQTLENVPEVNSNLHDRRHYYDNHRNGHQGHSGWNLRQSHTNEKPVFAWMPKVQNDHNGELAILKRKFLAILNKLSEENFKELLDEIRDLRINHNDKWKLCITMIVQKASNEKSFSSVYAQLCLRISRFQKSFEQSLKKEISASFNKEQGEIMEKIKELQEQIDCEINVDTKEELKCEESLMRHKILGTIRFMGELFLVNVLSSQEICRYMELLVSAKNISQESVECLCRLLMRIGYKIAQTDSKLLGSFFNKLEKIKNGKLAGTKVSSRHVFLIRDLMDLRANHWMSVVVKNGSEPMKMITIKLNRNNNDNSNNNSNKNDFQKNWQNYKNESTKTQYAQPPKVLAPPSVPALPIQRPIVKKDITSTTSSAGTKIDKKPLNDFYPKFKATTSEIISNGDATRSNGCSIKILKRGDELKAPETIQTAVIAKADTDKTVKKLWMAFSEYLTNEIYEELLLEIQEVKGWTPEIVETMIVKCIEYGKKETTVCEMFSKLVLQKKLITSQLFLEAIKMLMMEIDDLAIDILNIYDAVADLLENLIQMQLLCGDEVAATVESNEEMKMKFAQQKPAKKEEMDANNNTNSTDEMIDTSEPAIVGRFHTGDSGISVEEKTEKVEVVEEPVEPLNRKSIFDLFMAELKKEESNFQDVFNAAIKKDLRQNAEEDKITILDVLKDIENALMTVDSVKLMDFMEFAILELLGDHIIEMQDVYDMYKVKMKCDFEKNLLLRLLKAIHEKLDAFDEMKTLPNEPFVQKDFKFQKLMKQSGWKLDKKKKHH